MDGCAPVPKARPGSITTGNASGSTACQGGPTHSGPMRTAWWNSRQRTSQPSSTCPDLGIGEGGENPLCRFAVGRELDSPGGLDLLEPGGAELDEPSSQLLRFVRVSGDGRANQLNALFSFSKKLGSCR